MISASSQSLSSMTGSGKFFVSLGCRKAVGFETLPASLLSRHWSISPSLSSESSCQSSISSSDKGSSAMSSSSSPSAATTASACFFVERRFLKIAFSSFSPLGMRRLSSFTRSIHWSRVPHDGHWPDVGTSALLFVARKVVERHSMCVRALHPLSGQTSVIAPLAGRPFWQIAQYSQSAFSNAFWLFSRYDSKELYPTSTARIPETVDLAVESVLVLPAADSSNATTIPSLNLSTCCFVHFSQTL